MKMTKLILLTLGLIIILQVNQHVQAQNDNNFEIAKNLDIYTSLIKELNTNYVENLTPGELMKTGIDAMLNTLDPYTVYIPEAEVEDYKFITTGQYGGIGALIQKQGKKIVVAEPYEGNPAHLYGLKAGDQLLEVDGKELSGMNTSEVSTLLKGQPGTEVEVKLKRPGSDDVVNITLIRKNVKIDNIPYYEILDESIGYIKLSGFTQNAGKEVKDAFLELKNNNPMAGIILDLRGNGGGLLQEAVKICNLFIDKGEVIVSTKGKLSSKNNTYRTLAPALDKEIPLIILVDNSSASASEIVAGAIQDHDRGVIVGQKTFGKGLVQNVLPLSYNAQAKITVAKYYIPSGRCIQEIDYSKKDANGKSVKKADSLAIAFKTNNGRTVYDGHGIAPDVAVEMDTLSEVSYSLLTKFHFFNFATDFALKHDSIAPASEFTIGDGLFSDFKEFVDNKGFEFTTRTEKSLEEMKKIAEEDGYFATISDEYEALLEDIKDHKKNALDIHKDEIKRILKIEIISRYYFQKGKIMASLANDRELDKAKELIRLQNDYLAILDGSVPADSGKN